MPRVNVFIFAVGMMAALCRTTPAQDYMAMLKKAQRLRQQEEYQAADSLYQIILKGNPDDPDVMVGRGYCQLNLPGRLGEAEKIFNTVIADAPEYVDAYLGLAHVYRRQGENGQARIILVRCRDAVRNDPEKVQYLAIGTWQLGFITLARQLDAIAPPADDRVLVTGGGRISPYISYSPLAAGSYWQTTGASFLKFLRPDLGGSVLLASHNRDGNADIEGGISLFYRVSTALTAEYRMYGSDNDIDGYLPVIRMIPGGTWQVREHTGLSGGAELAKYADGWLLTGKAGIRQKAGPVLLHYRFRGGIDPYDQTVLAHVADVSLGNEENLSGTVGGAYGNETVEMTGAAYTGQEVMTIFGTLRKTLGRRLAVSLTVAGEWRDSEYYRAIITVAPQISF